MVGHLLSKKELYSIFLLYDAGFGPSWSKNGDQKRSFAETLKSTVSELDKVRAVRTPSIAPFTVETPLKELVIKTVSLNPRLMMAVANTEQFLTDVSFEIEKTGESKATAEKLFGPRPSGQFEAIEYLDQILSTVYDAAERLGIDPQQFNREDWEALANLPSLER